MNRAELLQSIKARFPLLPIDARERLTRFVEQAGGADADTKRKELVLLAEEAIKGNNTKYQELNRLRAIVVDNFVVAQSNAGSFFDQIKLEADEEPILVNDTGLEMKARVIGEDGRPHLTQILKKMSKTPIPLELVSTRLLEYPLRDLYRGTSVRDDVLNAAPLSRDLSIAIDQKLWVLIKALPVAAYVTTGAESARAYVLHSAIKAANIPSGNLIDVTGTSGAKFNFVVIKAIVKYFIQVGNTFGDPLMPKAIFVPSVDLSGFIDDISLTSDGTNPGVQQIFENGYVVSLAGRSIMLVGDATLDPALGLAYVSTNKPIGKWFTKPSLDQTIPGSTEEIPVDWRLENKGRVAMQKVFGAVTSNRWGMNMLAVKYK
jgi:hypothetical protein